MCSDTILAPYFFWILLLLLCPQQRKRPKLRLRGEAVPAVDVMLTTCGEVVPMILDTVLAACNIDYPTNRYRIIICDDDNDTLLAEALQPMLAEYPQLFYQAREKIEGVHHHYKAGNLQSGIDFAAALEGGAGEFLATLDSDMVPHPEWLRALLPHLLRDDKLGLVSPPQACFSPFPLFTQGWYTDMVVSQTFYNVPVDDPLCQSICDFIHFMEVKKDAMGAAWCTGSGVVFKRFILEEMGGWPTASMAEDQLLSSMMNGMGYKAGYIHEFMQCGLIPESIINRESHRQSHRKGKKC